METKIGSDFTGFLYFEHKKKPKQKKRKHVTNDNQGINNY